MAESSGSAAAAGASSSYEEAPSSASASASATDPESDHDDTGRVASASTTTKIVGALGTAVNSALGRPGPSGTISQQSAKKKENTENGGGQGGNGAEEDDASGSVSLSQVPSAHVHGNADQFATPVAAPDAEITVDESGDDGMTPAQKAKREKREKKLRKLKVMKYRHASAGFTFVELFETLSVVVLLILLFTDFQRGNYLTEYTFDLEDCFNDCEEPECECGFLKRTPITPTSLTLGGWRYEGTRTEPLVLELINCRNVSNCGADVPQTPDCSFTTEFECEDKACIRKDIPDSGITLLAAWHSCGFIVQLSDGNTAFGYLIGMVVAASVLGLGLGLSTYFCSSYSMNRWAKRETMKIHQPDDDKKEIDATLADFKAIALVKMNFCMCAIGVNELLVVGLLLAAAANILGGDINIYSTNILIAEAVFGAIIACWRCCNGQIKGLLIAPEAVAATTTA